ncbi:lytic transglycosylase domain-containing protein [Nitratireductor luteus]|uniref:lytic transglycosylase domain-containing protein n=1 Tax=Nitratireductor luteus TaxID=2976980 RepID=UPI00223FDE2C|nr:lytic transglycosylase domain-containing protein [Nitratireductor luteus]
MRSCIVIAFQGFIPLFAEMPSHPFVPLGRSPAGARSEGQGRPWAGALRVPLIAASTLAGSGRGGDRAVSRCAVLLLAGMLALGAAPAAVVAQERQAEHVAVADPYAAYIHEASQQFGMPAAWIRAVLRAESAGDVGANSSAGAMGLMQIMPDTWAELRVRYGLGRDPFDPRDNILAGAAYLREMFDRYGNIAAILAAYNAGPERYDEYLSAASRALPAETRAYVAALAPLLGGDMPPGTIITAASAPPDWREAALFVVRSISARVTDAVRPGDRPSDVTAPLPVRDVSPIEPQTGDLFVARASAGEQQ